MSSNAQKLVEALTGPMQAVEDLLSTLYTERRVDTAVGTQLDMLGAIVAQSRNGLSDDDYRRYIRAKIAANKSDGLVEDLIKIVRLIVDDDALYVRVDNYGRASTAINLEDVVIPELVRVIQDFMLDASADGVTIYTRYWPRARAGLFTFSEGGGAGFGWTGDALLGGRLAGAME